jgi:hypothetical protein
LVRELVGASELVGFELMEFEAPSNRARRARAVQTVIRMIEPVFRAGPDDGTRRYEPRAMSQGDQAKGLIPRPHAERKEAEGISRSKPQQLCLAIAVPPCDREDALGVLQFQRFSA